MNVSLRFSAQNLFLFSRQASFLTVLVFFAALNSNCQVSVAHRTDGQLIDLFNQNEREFSRLAEMAQEDRKLWRITMGDSISANKFEIYSENNFRDAAEEDVSLERRNEYVELMKKTGVAVLLKEDVSKNQLGVFLSNTKKNFSENHHSEKGFLYTRARIDEDIFESLDDKNKNENYRPPILDFRAVKQDWFLYYRSE